MSSHHFVGTPSPEQAAEKVGVNELLSQTNAADAADAAATTAMDFEFPMEDTNPIHTSHRSSRRNSFVEPGIDMSDSSVKEKIRHYEKMNKDVLVEIAKTYGINPYIYNPLTRRSDKKNRKQLAADIFRHTGGGKSGN